MITGTGLTTRRSFLKSSGMAASAALCTNHLLFAAQAQPQQEAPPPAAPNIIQSMLAAGPTTPIRSTKLTDTLFLLQGVGGNMVLRIGPDGKLLIDSSVATAAHRLLQTLDKLGTHPLKLLINTHWHFDHTNGNAVLHDEGAFIVAHENTRLRLSTPQHMALMNLNFEPSPTSALPQQTFTDREKLFFNNEEFDLVHTPNAHTDSDIYIHVVNANVIHAGDLWFNGMYPLIDESTGGTINGMIRGVDEVLQLADDKTKIVPGHGPLGDKPALTNYRAMLAAVANRIEKMKIAGKSLAQVIAQKPTADMDATWGQGSMKPDMFVTVVYNTL
jgi:cyclase